MKVIFIALGYIIALQQWTLSIVANMAGLRERDRKAAIQFAESGDEIKNKLFELAEISLGPKE